MIKRVNSGLALIIPVLTISMASVVCHAQDQAGAPPLAEMNAKLAQLGGSMQAVATQCGGYSAKELAQMKEQQKQGLTQAGMTAEQFEQAFAQGEQEANKGWDAMPGDEQAEACDQIRSARSVAPQ